MTVKTKPVVCGLLMSAAWSLTWAGVGQLSQKEVYIAAQPLDAAIHAWSVQTGYQVLLPADADTSTQLAPMVKGSYDPEGALKSLLASTGLQYEFVNARTVAIRVADAAGAGRSASDSRVAAIEPEQRSGGGPAGGDLEQVVVTAQKREERLISVPQSVTVVSADDLSKLGAAQFRDFATTVPGLTFTTEGAGRTQVSLRGVTIGSDLGATVAIYVDDVPYTSSGPFSSSGAFALDVGLFDVDRIEVLRGPQGTLYGASTMGGLLKYISRRPDTRTFSGSTQAGVATTLDGGVSFNVAGAINAPIVPDKIGIRLNGFESRDGGYIDNLSLGRDDVNRSDVYGGRLDVLFTPTDALSFRLTGFLQDVSRDGKANADYSVAGVPQFGEFGQSRSLEEPFDHHFRLVSGTLGYDFGSGLELTSISSYESSETEYVTDLSVGYVPLLARFNRFYSAVGNPVRIRTRRLVQEVRLAGAAGAPLEWRLGAFYTRDNSTNDQSFALYDLAGRPAANDLFIFANPTQYEEYAEFGDFTWHLSSKFDVSAGLRYAKNHQVFEQIGSGAFGRSLSRRTATDDAFTYLGNARYHVNDRATVYVRYATGYRPGGPNIFTVNATTGQPNGATTFGSDTLKSYEAGFKAETPGRNFAFDVAGYYIDWKNIQLTTVRGGFSTIANVPDGARVRGTELTLTARPLRDLSFTGAFAYQDAELAAANADVGGADGERLPNVPHFTASLGADYAIGSGSWRPSIGATVRYVGERTSSFNGSLSSPQYHLPEYTTVDLRAALSLDRVSLQFYARNLFDERAELSEAPAPQALSLGRIALYPPRTFGINARVDF